MAFEAVTILQLVLLITWTCLCDTPVNQKHTLFDQIIPSLEVLEELFMLASFEFAPGLFAVLQATAPPTIQYFKSLPTGPVKSWAVYLLVLEKANCRPRIYIGSGTDGRCGVHRRFCQYDSSSALPKYVAKALDEGYEIVHKSLICWIPIPVSFPLLHSSDFKFTYVC
jgi:hypothetical protein